MAKILVFQHVPYEPLGLLDPMLRQRRHRIRYINFGRPRAQIPDVRQYDALIVLGGPMNIGQESQYPHLAHERSALRAAVEAGIPTLGICLGAQLLASALGARVYPARRAEIGWCRLYQTSAGRDDPVTRHFHEPEPIFQWHGYTFDLPADGVHLLRGDSCPNQAFRIGPCGYGFQFHLEASEPVIERWLTIPQHQRELAGMAPDAAARIRADSEQRLPRSRQLAEQVFGAFLDLLPAVQRQHQLASK